MMLKLGILFAVALFLETASAASVSVTQNMYFSCLQNLCPFAVQRELSYKCGNIYSQMCDYKSAKFYKSKYFVLNFINVVKKITKA